MEAKDSKKVDIETVISKNNDEIELEKEDKFVNLLIEIIVASTLKEYYEKGNQIPEV